jgi:1,4-dihydroxy-2-naphthoyl-CoA hydrolase
VRPLSAGAATLAGMFDALHDRARPEWWLERQRGTLPELVGIEPLSLGEGEAVARLVLRPEHGAPNGYLHAATVIALADTICGYGCVANLPDKAVGFTTIELKSNFLGTATDGALRALSRMVHGGRTTQVWDAVVVHEASERTIALFRCTQMILWPRGA